MDPTDEAAAEPGPPLPKQQRRVREFHAAFLASLRPALSHSRLHLPQYLMQSMAADVLRPWAVYRTWLHRVHCLPERIATVLKLWRLAGGDERVGGEPAEAKPGEVVSQGELLSPFVISELAANTPREFVQLLKRIRSRAQGGPTGIHERSGIGRSQIYSMTDEKRSGLPTRGEQVRSFLEACGLPPVQVEHVLKLWVRLRENPQPYRHRSQRRSSDREKTIVRTFAEVVSNAMIEAGITDTEELKNQLEIIMRTNRE
ncbi:hypothetical protein D5S17_31545 [Pseudonocardiaceae bacterium YIM PH 21723]|nr:hypothetical protein D5S17_31545 [Pseudonocardiaceae bacterium YIM PH 21723]